LIFNNKYIFFLGAIIVNQNKLIWAGGGLRPPPARGGKSGAYNFKIKLNKP